MKLLASIAIAGLLAHSALQAQEAPSTDVDTGSDADLSLSSALPSAPPATPLQVAAPTTPDEAAALDQTLYGEDQALAEASAEPDAQSRPWKLNLHATATGRYDDNIFISPTGKQHDFITDLSAGGGLTLGDYTARQANYLITDYTGTGDIFERHTYEDAYEQAASLLGQIVTGHLTFKADIEFHDLADEVIDIGTRTRHQIYNGDFSARYDISDKSFLEATAKVTIADYALYLDSNDERGGLSFNYLPDPDVTIGLGATAGILNVEDSSSQTYEQLLASMQVLATGKFTVKADAGVEDRQLENGGSLVTPVFDLTGDYKPFQGFDLSLTGFRRVLNSAYYSGADYISTGLNAEVRYELSARFSVLFDAGFEHTNYRDISTGASISRTDNYYFVRPALRYTASRYCNVELYYFHRDNYSTVITSSFDNTQAGISFNFTY